VLNPAILSVPKLQQKKKKRRKKLLCVVSHHVDIYYTKDKKSQPLARLRFSAVSDWTQCGTSSLELSEKSPTTKTIKTV
jgi:hypothetical protein